MKLETAISLIKQSVTGAGEPRHWLELGAGSGLFTNALSTLLPGNSSILAVDQDAKALWSIQPSNEITLTLQVQDFTEFDAPQSFDGILIANALHYVKDTAWFLSKLKAMLKPGGHLVVVEYDHRKANKWVPYPVDYQTLETISRSTGFKTILKLGEVPSVYDGATIYSALLK